MKVAIIGAGMGGLASAAALAKVGIAADIYEQTARFTRVGAGIHATPNAIKVLLGLGLSEQTLRDKAHFRKRSRNREFDTGRLTGELVHGEEMAELYGAPYTTWHRGDLHEALMALVEEGVVHRDKKLVGIDLTKDGVTMRFGDGTAATADAVIGADGIHSVVRSAIGHEERPRFTGRLAYRSVIPRSAVRGVELDESCKWWGPDRHFVHYLVSGGNELAFTTAVPEDDWDLESWSTPGDLATLRREFADFHPHVQAILAAVTEVNRWAINVHRPLSSWSEGRVVILGDAAHMVTPFMAQGAALAMEDAVVLARCLAQLGGDKDGIGEAFGRFEATRKPRTTEIGAQSEANTWGRFGGDPSWVFGYDAWTDPILTPARRS